MSINLTLILLVDLFMPQANVGLKSNLTHLNLINQEFFNLNDQSLGLVLSICPKLEQIQFKCEDDVTTDATDFFVKHTPNLKEILSIRNTLSASALALGCP